MRKIEGEQTLMRIFVGEAHQWQRRPLYLALVDLFRQKGLAGATVLRAVAGFGPSSILHTAGIFKLSADLPIVIEVVDTQEHLDAVLPEVDRMMSGGMITMEKVRVVRYSVDEPSSALPPKRRGHGSRSVSSRPGTGRRGQAPS